MDKFQEIANQLLVYKIRGAWFEIAKVYNEMALQHGGTLSMAFILLAINDEFGSPVTKIAPRMGMEPNSLSRSLKALEKKGCVYKRKDKKDKRMTYICLTDHGRELRDVALNAVFNLNKNFLEHIPEEKMEVFFEVLEQITPALKEFRKDALEKEANATAANF